LQQFALASVYPRSIAWLIRIDEWDRLEEIIKYNCAMVGGYFNVIIPLTVQDMISEDYQQFLVDYDPDLIILAPGITSIKLEASSLHIHPFAVIPWDSISGVASLDPLGGGSGINATIATEWIRMSTEVKHPVSAFVAVADHIYPHTSKLALVACGDIEPREPMWNVIDDEVDFDATGYREHFLERLLMPEHDRSNAGASLDENYRLILAPDRYQLANLISEEHKFPLSDAVKILKTCCSLQHFPWLHQSFIGLTTSYHKTSGTPQRLRGKRYPAMTILVSDYFGIEEAVLFWNLRANAVYVAWLSFSELESQFDKVIRWLESDELSIFLLTSGSLNIAFSSLSKDFTRLQAIIDSHQSKRRRGLPNWYVELHTNLVFYDYIRPYIGQERVMVAKDRSRCTFVPKLPQENTFSGMYAVTLEWNGLMLPQNSILVHNRISPKTDTHLAISKEGRKVITETIKIPKFRIASNRYLRSQISAEEPLEFNRPSSDQVVETLFIAARFSRIEPSSTAKYHRNFVDRANGLEEVAHYLATSP
jgi:hypothetical protein